MSEEKSNLGRAIEEVKAVIPAKEVYEDIAQPLAKELGRAGGTAGSLVNSVLRPLKSLDTTWNLMFDNLDFWLNEKLKHIPKEEIIEPKPSIAGNVLAGLAFAQEEPVLRDMFLELLATSMIKSKHLKAHPSYAGILKELTPDEARINKYLSKAEIIPIIRIRARIRDHKSIDSLRIARCNLTRILDKTGESSDNRNTAMCNGYWDSVSNNKRTRRIEVILPVMDESFHKEYYDPTPWAEELLATSFPKSVRIDQPEHIPLYLDNIIRNRLAHIYLDNTFSDEDEYKQIYKCDTVKEITKRFTEQGLDVTTLPCVISVTNFGKSFYEACIGE